MLSFIVFGSILFASAFGYMFYICWIEPQGLTDAEWIPADSQK